MTIDFEALDRRTQRMGLGEPMTMKQTLVALRDEAPFRSAWSRALASLPYTAFRWEMPRLSAETLQAPFEAVVVDAPTLERPQDQHAFGQFFEQDDGADVVTTPNLGGDALLVIPRPRTQDPCYCHLASFLRGAPQAQIDALWRDVATATLERVANRTVWLSTAGGGVAWLHVRLDARPKYYAHRPYAQG